MRCQHVGCGTQALKFLESAQSLPDLIVCDVHMPDMNGFDFLRRVRQDSHTKQISIIMLTSDASVETELSLIESGADVFLTKTQDPRILCAHARRLIDKRRAA